MAVHALTNSRWGFESKCFVCEPSNEWGLQIPFTHDDVDGVVRATFELDHRFSGAPNYVHGGLVLTVLDEAMAWATIALAGSFALTRTTTASFLRPVRVGEPCRVEAKVVGETEGGDLEVTGVVRNARGQPCAEARAVFVPMSAAQASSAIGEVAGDDAGYVQG